MIVYPAIDLRQGRVVRLKHGDPSQQMTFSTDPVQTARNWIDNGASWLHVVNLDGAFDADSDNLRIMARIAALGVPVQFGGGLRSADRITMALQMGASRVVVGTLAVQQPDIVAQAIHQHGAERICIGLDARDGMIATHGWQETTGLTPAAFGREMASAGAIHALYTDVGRDGTQQGVDIPGTIALAQDTKLQVIASGGVATLDEVHLLAASGVVAGIIVGMALYRGSLALPEVIEAAKGLTNAG